MIKEEESKEHPVPINKHRNSQGTLVKDFILKEEDEDSCPTSTINSFRVVVRRSAKKLQTIRGGQEQESFRLSESESNNSNKFQSVTKRLPVRKSQARSMGNYYSLKESS